ncbi:MAG: hypothetical protein KFB93_00635 [Simkaniaceae bacterium]|nr:MAG: hypothetical protein KFB93_00635 [Simkaniaceae bacterium]
MSDIEDLTEEEIKEIKEFYPPFIAKKMIELTDEINNRKPTHIDDFYRLHLATWKISNKTYQEQHWGKQGQWGDNYSETMEEFLGTGEAVLDANTEGRVEMTPNQREMLKKLYDMLDDFDGDGDSADDPGYGINDAAIIEDPKFDKCRKYAKLVYEELSGDDLDAWERSKN